MSPSAYCGTVRRLSSIRDEYSPSKNNKNNVQRLNIDGFFFQSLAIANMLRSKGLIERKDNKGSNQKFESRELIFRNITIDDAVLKGAEELLNRKEDDTNDLKAKTDIDIIHCSGMVSELIRLVLPYTRRFGFAGNIPIAHNLDTEGLEALGERLGNQNSDNRGVVQLQSLILKGTRLDSAGFSQFCYGLRHNTSLEELHLSNCILIAEDVRLLASTLRANKTLKSIFFSDCKFGTKHRVQQTTIRNGRLVQSTQSINDVYPQTNLPTVLMALVGHPTLESLKIFDMICNHAAIEAIGQIVRDQESKLKTLALKNNLSHPKAKLPGLTELLLPAVSRNQNLIYLKLSGNNLDDGNMNELSRILTQPTTSIQTLSLSGNLISNGLLSLAANIQDAKSLRCLDLLMNPINEESRTAIISALKNNVQIERLDLGGSLNDDWNDKKFWWLSLNKGGRRVLQSKSLSTALWPRILERAYNIPVRRKPRQPAQTKNVGVAYHLIRRIPGLFEKASFKDTARETPSPTTITTAPIWRIVQSDGTITGTPSIETTNKEESRGDIKRQREATDSTEPKAKRMFTP